MERKRRSWRGRRIHRWFLRKQKRADPFQLTEISDGGEGEDDFSSPSPGVNPCIANNELRIFVGTWNVAGRSPVGSLDVDLDEWLNLRDAADIYVLGLQEIVPLKATTVIGVEDPTEATNWNLLIGKTLNNRYGCPWLTPLVHPITNENYHYDRVPVSERRPNDSAQMANLANNQHGIRFEHRNQLSRHQLACVGTSFCFIAAHLASGEKKGDEGRRNHQSSQIFWFGDLNYRLYLEDNLARQLIKEQDWRALQKFDQLRRELEHGGVFQGWKEGNIEFAPTYKYSSYNCNRYSGGLPSRAGEKQRTPAWCDRILWYGKGVRQLSYFRSESKFSDHRPVSAMFSTQIAVVKSAISSCPTVPTTLMKSPSKMQRHQPEMASGEATPTLLSLIVQDM
ncbi:UNVERIFIED_CONTAM: Type I inositol polyphosphate 5-phosphatase 8 [Sesamum calycinum]|uniref:Type I inositol polyphosphate 5-phosphatase 8 n=1 Tax=Sesamum calycinum TaxID=2727403 RepID=A0AAW2MKW6_9LAMI